MRFTTFIGAVAAIGLSAGVASAATFTFNTVGPQVASLGGPGFTITPGSAGLLNSSVLISQTATGLGVNGNPDTNPGNIDGFPIFSSEFLTVNFHWMVTLKKIALGNVDSNDDVDLFLDNTLIGSYKASVLNSADLDADITSFRIRASGTFLADGLGNDDFTLSGFTVAPVPLPAAGLMLIGGMAALGGMRKRKA
jgi:hypothetical protein